MLIFKIKLDVNNWVNIVIKHIINNNKRELNLKHQQNNRVIKYNKQLINN